jgi:hypothetical protein
MYCFEWAQKLSLLLREEYRSRIFENIVLGSILISRRKKLTRWRRKLSNDEHVIFALRQTFIKVNNSRIMM